MQHRMPPPLPESEQVPEVIGKWEKIEAEFLNAATHAALLPTNKIWIYGGSSLDRDEFEHPTLPRAEILDMNVTPWKTYPLNCEPMSCDLWCGGHTFLADGKLLFVGGTNYYPPPPPAPMPASYARRTNQRTVICDEGMKAALKVDELIALRRSLFRKVFSQ